MTVQDFNIDPEFSLFRLVKRKRDQGFTTSHVEALQEISTEIENAIFGKGKNEIIFCGFQYMSRFLDKHERYQRLAQACEHIYIFAIFDESPPEIDNITFVPLNEGDNLSEEWFLITYGKEFYSAFCAHEETPSNTPYKDRLFTGTWLFDLNMVEILYDWLCRKVGLDPEHIAQSQAVIRNEIEMMEKTIERVQDFIQREQALNHQATVDEIRTFLDISLYPALEDLRNQTPA